MLLGTLATLFSSSHPWHTSQFTLGMLAGLHACRLGGAREEGGGSVDAPLRKKTCIKGGTEYHTLPGLRKPR